MVKRQIVRIARTDLEGDEKARWSLTDIKGIGVRVANAVCGEAGVDPNAKLGSFSEEEVNKIEKIIENLKETDSENKIPGWMLNRKKDFETGEDLHLTGSELDFQVQQDIDHLQDINAYRGIRHKLGLPVRGQRTRGNFRGGTTLGVSREKISEAKEEAEAEEEEE